MQLLIPADVGDKKTNITIEPYDKGYGLILNINGETVKVRVKDFVNIFNYLLASKKSFINKEFNEIFKL